MGAECSVWRVHGILHPTSPFGPRVVHRPHRGIPKGDFIPVDLCTWASLLDRKNFRWQSPPSLLQTGSGLSNFGLSYQNIFLLVNKIAFSLRLLPIGSNLCPDARQSKIPSLFYLRVLWVFEDSHYFLYGVSSASARTFPGFRIPRDMISGPFYTWVAVFPAYCIVSGVGSEWDALPSPERSKCFTPIHRPVCSPAPDAASFTC